MNRGKNKDVEQYLSTGGLMEMLGISRSTVYRLMVKGLPNIMVGSVHRFPKEQVLKWLQGGGDKQGVKGARGATSNSASREV